MLPVADESHDSSGNGVKHKKTKKGKRRPADDGHDSSVGDAPISSKKKKKNQHKA